MTKTKSSARLHPFIAHASLPLMWPHKHGLGSRLGYGVDGPGYLLVESPESTNVSETSVSLKYNCARLQNYSPRFVPITKPIALGPKSSPLEEPIPDSRYKLTRAALKINEAMSCYIPSDMCKSLLMESAALDSHRLIDPSQGALFAVSYGAARKDQPRRLDIMAYIGGQHQSVLYVSHMKRQYLPDDFQFASEESCDDAETEAVIGILDFKDPIKQVLFMPINSPALRCLIVRTSFKVVVLFIKSESGTEQSVIPIKSITAADFFDHELADIAIDPNNERYFAVMDVKGYIRMWRVNDGQMLVVVAHRVSPLILTYEPASLSRWRRLVWCGDVLLVFSRSRVVQHTSINSKKDVATFISYNSKVILSADVWAHLQDVQVCHGQIFLLTSRELMWCRIEAGKFERVLSWKHSLNGDDNTLRLDATFLPVSDEHVCLIRSLLNPLALVYTFGVQGGRPVMLCDPYAVQVSLCHEELLHTHIAWPDTTPSPKVKPKVGMEPENVDMRYFGFYALHRSEGLTKCILSRCEDPERTKTATTAPFGGVMKSDAHVVRPLQKSVAHYSFQCRRKDLRAQIILFQKNSLRIPQDQSDSIQECALKLGEGDLEAGRFNSFFTLADFTKHLPSNISDTTDFDNMLEQLSEFYSTKQASLSFESFRFISPSTPSEPAQTVTQLEGILAKAEPSGAGNVPFNTKTNHGIAAISLGLSLVTVKKDESSDQLKSTFLAKLNSCSARVKSFLAEWGDEKDFTQTGEEPRNPVAAMTVPRLKPANSQNLSQVTSSQSRASQRRLNQKVKFKQESRLASQEPQTDVSSERRAAQLQSSFMASRDDFMVGLQSEPPQLTSGTQRLSQKHTYSQSSQGGSSQKKKKKKRGGFS